MVALSLRLYYCLHLRTLEIRRFVSMMVAIFAVHFQCIASDLESPEDLAIFRRRAIQSGEMSIMCEVEDRRKSEFPSKFDRIYYCVFDGQKLRRDLTQMSWPSTDLYREAKVITEEHVIRYAELNADGKRVGSDIQRLSKGSERSGNKLADPRLIGLIPTEWENLSNYDFKFIAELRQRDGFMRSAEQADFDGYPSWVVTYTLPTFSIMWTIVPDWDYAVVACTITPSSSERYTPARPLMLPVK